MPMIPATAPQKARLLSLIEATDEAERDVSEARYDDLIGKGIRDLYDKRLDRIRNEASSLIMYGAYRSREP